MCLHCEESHHGGTANCLKTSWEINVNKIRAEKGFSYTEAVEGMERNDGLVVVRQELEKKQNGADQNICMGRK